MVYLVDSVPLEHRACFEMLDDVYRRLSMTDVVIVDDKHRIMLASGHKDGYTYFGPADIRNLESLLGKDYFEVIFGLDLSNNRDQKRASNLPLYKVLTRELQEAHSLISTPKRPDILYDVTTIPLRHGELPHIWAVEIWKWFGFSDNYRYNPAISQRIITI